MASFFIASYCTKRNRSSFYLQAQLLHAAAACSIALQTSKPSLICPFDVEEHLHEGAGNDGISSGSRSRKAIALAHLSCLLVVDFVADVHLVEGDEPGR